MCILNGIQTFGSTSIYYLIKDRVMLSLHIGSVNSMRNCHTLGLGNDHGLIAVLLKCCVKSIVNARFFFNNALVADFLPPIWVDG
jgi:hypothetical protein